MGRLKKVAGAAAALVFVAFPIFAFKGAHSFFDTLDLSPYLICFACGLAVALLTMAIVCWLSTSQLASRRRVAAGAVLFWLVPPAMVVVGLATNARFDRSPVSAHRTMVLDWVVQAKGGAHCDVRSWRSRGREEINADLVDSASGVSPPAGPVVAGAAASPGNTDQPGARTRRDTIPPDACTPGRAVTVYTRAGRLGWERAVGLSREDQRAPATNAKADLHR